MDPDVLTELVGQVHKATSPKNETTIGDPARRNELLYLAKRLLFMLEPPEDLIIKQGFMPTVNLALRVLVDQKVFEMLAEHDSFMTTSELANIISADELLLTRLLRAAHAVNFVDEVGVNSYRANRVTKAIANPGLEAGFSHAFDKQTRPKSLLWEFVKYLRRSGYRKSESVTERPLQIANDCIGQSAFEWWNNDPYPDEAIRFNTSMHAKRGSRPLCAEWFPMESLLSTSTSSEGDVLFVDVAGGHGTDIQAFAPKLSHMSGTLVLQDRASVLNEVSDNDLYGRNVKQPIDFFVSQPVKGAKIYFMHAILRDWSDKDCRIILEHLRDAMKIECSRILISDNILPDRDCPSIATAFDLTMMAFHCGTERTERMWRMLIDSVGGLQIVKFWVPPSGEGVVEVVRKH